MSAASSLTITIHANEGADLPLKAVASALTDLQDLLRHIEVGVLGGSPRLIWRVTAASYQDGAFAITVAADALPVEVGES